VGEVRAHKARRKVVEGLRIGGNKTERVRKRYIGKLTYHDSPTAGHPGIYRMYRQVLVDYW